MDLVAEWSVLGPRARVPPQDLGVLIDDFVPVTKDRIPMYVVVVVMPPFQAELGTSVAAEEADECFQALLAQ